MRKFLIISITVIAFVLSTVPALAVDRPSSWAAAEVQTAIGLGLVPAALQSNYTRPITRAEFASLVMNLPRMETKAVEAMETAAPIVFSDTADEDVIRSAALVIVEGDGKGHFMPEDPLTRQQAAKMLYKACGIFAPWVINEDEMITTVYRGYASCEMPHSWEDGANIRSYARAYINWCYRHNVINGMGGNRFAPEGGYTREQAILTVLRLYYTDGRAYSNPIQNAPDYYPIYEDNQMSSIRGWIDSSLNQYARDEIDQTWGTEAETFPSNQHKVALGGGVYAVQNTGTEIFVYDAFGDTLFTITTTEPVVFAGSANGLLYFQSQSALGDVYYTQTGKALPPFQ